MLKINKTVINTDIITSKISAGAFRVYCYVAINIDKNITNEMLMNDLNIKSNDSMAKYWKELFNEGLITYTVHKNERGKILGGRKYKIMR